MSEPESAEAADDAGPGHPSNGGRNHDGRRVVVIFAIAMALIAIAMWVVAQNQTHPEGVSGSLGPG